MIFVGRFSVEYHHGKIGDDLSNFDISTILFHTGTFVRGFEDHNHQVCVKDPHTPLACDWKRKGIIRSVLHAEVNPGLNFLQYFLCHPGLKTRLGYMLKLTPG